MRNDDRAELILKEDRTQDSGRLGTVLVDLKKEKGKLEVPRRNLFPPPKRSVLLAG